MLCSQRHSISSQTTGRDIAEAPRVRKGQSLTGRKRLITQVTDTGGGDGHASAVLEVTLGCADTVASSSCTLHRSKRGALERSDSLHRSAGSSTELAALDLIETPTPSSVSGKEADSLAAAGPQPAAAQPELQSPVRAQPEPLCLLPSAACVLPSSQQSSATAGPHDDARAAGPETELRAQQASSRSRFSSLASGPAPKGHSGGADAQQGRADVSCCRAGPALQEVAAFQLPRLPGGGGRRAHADIVCDVQFSVGGDLIATAGVGKQVLCSRIYTFSASLLSCPVLSALLVCPTKPRMRGCSHGLHDSQG